MASRISPVALSAVAAAVAALTLMVKVKHPPLSTSFQSDQVLNRVEVVLRAKGYNISERSGRIVRFSTRQDCHGTVWLVSRFGEDDAAVRAIAARTGGTLMFVFDGEVHEAQPVWRTILRHYWEVVNREIGRRVPIQPVLAVLSSPDCEQADGSWGDLAAAPP